MKKIIRSSLGILAFAVMWFLAAASYPSTTTAYTCDGDVHYLNNGGKSPATLYVSMVEYSLFNISDQRGHLNMELVFNNGTNVFAYERLEKSGDLTYLIQNIVSKELRGVLSQLSKKIEYRVTADISFAGTCALIG